MASETVSNHQEKALALLQADAEKILRLIKVQMDHLTMPQCPLYEEVLDTQMFGLSREVDFAVRLGLIAEEQGKAMLGELERELSALHEAFTTITGSNKGAQTEKVWAFYLYNKAGRTNVHMEYNNN